MKHADIVNKMSLEQKAAFVSGFDYWHLEEAPELGLPKLSDNMDPEDARALRSYLYQMQEQLQYVLTNLDTENMSDTLRSKLQGL